MKLNFEIYTPDLKNRHGIPITTAVSLEWWYNKIGRATLIVDADAESRSIIKKGCLLYDVNMDKTYTLQRVRYNSSTNTITANGYTSNWLLNQRAVIKLTKIVKVISGIYALISSNLRGLQGVKVASFSGEDVAAESTVYGGQLLDDVIPILNQQEMGHRMVWDDDTRQHTFEIYKGRDLSTGIHAVIFSQQRGTAKNLVLDQDNSTFKNVFYIPLLYTDGTEDVFEHKVGDPSDRREYWIKSVCRQKKEETKESFLERAKWRCQEEAEKRLKRQSFNANIDPTELGTAFDIGDKVACVSEDLGISFTARITGVKFTQDINGAVTSVVLGEPTLTVFDEVMMQ